MNPTYPLSPILNFFGFLLALFPFPAQLQAWNVGAFTLSLWSASACFIVFVNTIVWREGVANVAPVWCDICTSDWHRRQRVLTLPAAGHILAVYDNAVTGCIMVISRRLYLITRGKALTESKREVSEVGSNSSSPHRLNTTVPQKRFNFAFDLTFSLLFQIFTMATRTNALATQSSHIHAHKRDSLHRATIQLCDIRGDRLWHRHSNRDPRVFHIRHLVAGVHFCVCCLLP